MILRRECSFAVVLTLGTVLTHNVAVAQPGGGMNLGQLARAQQTLKAVAVEDFVPDYGYVVYGEGGEVLKAFGPDTPVQVDPLGNIFITGADLPAGAVVKTEDGPTFVQALSSVEADNPSEDSDITKTLRGLVDSISDGAEYVELKLCPHPARPTKITVEIEGGFDFYVHGSVVSTVDWDLEAMCDDQPVVSSP